MNVDDGLMAAIQDAERFLELMKAEPSLLYAHALREAAGSIWHFQQAKEQEAEAAALAKEMSPDPTVRVLLRNATGGGQIVDWPADHPALKDRSP